MKGNPSAAPPRPEVHDATRGEGGSALSSVSSLQRSRRSSTFMLDLAPKRVEHGTDLVERSARRFSELVIGLLV
jgi:hypothetical protein